MNITQKSSFSAHSRVLLSWLRNQLKLATLTTRRLIFFIIFLLILLYYFLPFIYRNSFTFKSTELAPCSPRSRDGFAKMIEEHDAVMYEMPSVGVTKPSDQGPFPFVGNGLLGTAAIYDSSNSLFLFHRNSDQKIQLLNLGADVLITPAFQLNPVARQDSYSINFRQGEVERFTCFFTDRFSRRRVTTQHKIIAHRSRPNLLLQRITTRLTMTSLSSTRDTMTLHLRHDTLQRNSAFLLVDNPEKRFKMYSYILSPSKNNFITIVIATTHVPKSVKVGTSPSNIDCITVLMTSEPRASKQLAEGDLSTVVEATLKYMDEVLTDRTVDQLFEEHQEAWTDILHTGLTIDTSTHENMEPGIPEAT